MANYTNVDERLQQLHKLFINFSIHQLRKERVTLAAPFPVVDEKGNQKTRLIEFLNESYFLEYGGLFSPFLNLAFEKYNSLSAGDDLLINQNNIKKQHEIFNEKCLMPIFIATEKKNENLFGSYLIVLNKQLDKCDMDLLSLCFLHEYNRIIKQPPVMKNERGLSVVNINNVILHYENCQQNRYGLTIKQNEDGSLDPTPLINIDTNKFYQNIVQLTLNESFSTFKGLNKYNLSESLDRVNAVLNTTQDRDNEKGRDGLTNDLGFPFSAPKPTITGRQRKGLRSGRGRRR